MSRVVVTCLFALCGGGSNNAFLCDELDCQLAEKKKQKERKGNRKHCLAGD